MRMRLLVGALLIPFLLYGCATGYDHHKKWDIWGDPAESVQGKAIRNLNAMYWGVNSSSINRSTFLDVVFIFFREPTVMTDISFDVARGTKDDIEKLHEAINTFLAAKYKNRYSVRLGQDNIYYDLKIDKDADDEVLKLVGGIYLNLGGFIHVTLKCPWSCDTKFLVSLLEANPVAPLSPQAQKNWEELKSRLE